MPKASAHDVITFGSATRDVFLRSSAFEVHERDDGPTGVEACFPLGAKINVDELMFETGGGATNAAVTFARLGFSVSAVSSIGDDAGGREIRTTLEKSGVATDLLQSHRNGRTGYSIIIVAGSGERTILVFRGASNRLAPARIPWKRLAAKWFYMSSLGGRIDIAERVLRHAERVGAKVAWNPGGSEIKLGVKRLEPLIAKTEVFNLNREEAALLTGHDRKDLGKIIGRLEGLPKRALLVTDGLGGTYAAAGGATLHAGIVDVPRVNTTGAGDAFGSGFVSGLLKKDDIRYALAVGTWNATGVVQEMGAKRGLLARFPSPRAIAEVPIRPWN